MMNRRAFLQGLLASTALAPAALRAAPASFVVEAIEPENSFVVVREQWLEPLWRFDAMADGSWNGDPLCYEGEIGRYEGIVFYENQPAGHGLSVGDTRVYGRKA
jgi:hypothetical protein